LFISMKNKLAPIFGKTFRGLLGPFFCLMIAVGCSTVPETHRQQLILTSPEEEARMGAVAFQEIKRNSKVSNNATYQQRVNRIGNRIVRAAPVEQSGWEFVVFEDAEPNAFALPNRKVGVTTGLMRLANTDDMLATVIAHEVGHVVARHGGERSSQGLLANIGGTLLDVGLAVGTDISPAARAGILGVYGAGATVGVILPFSRTHEYEADRLGLMYMARAGYNPRASIAFWEAMMEDQKRRGQGKPPAFLSTHPVDEARIAQLQRLMPAAMADYERSGRRR